MAEEIFNEALGALALQPLDCGVSKAKWMSLKGNRGLADCYQALLFSIQTAKLATLGTCVFVLPYERYKKIVDGYRTFNPDASRAFGLDRYSNRSTFEVKFPSAEVVHWDSVSFDKLSWFTDCVRNSFAHGQTTFKRDCENRYDMVETLNAGAGMTPNFQVKMRVDDFYKLDRMLCWVSYRT